MQGLVPKLQLSLAQPCPLQSPMWSHVQDWMVLTWESVKEKDRDKSRENRELGVEARVCL